ncbi:hypothetical protein CK203_024532 [Vitis vinifera]|uniref:Uncharacterized protein n=1 Tax=Vitis vinifera TaxID=29760 RepID=A0A438IV40_VITVI|nr:hypothetical protein CK203_024532 [Vitis vinifera]
MSSKKKAASSARVGDAHEKSTDKLSVKEFRDRFCIPNGVIVDFFMGRTCVAHGIPPFHQDSTRLHSSQYYPGADGMQHHQHAVQPRPLTMLEVFFVYSLKKAKTDIFSLSAHLPSLQLVTELPDSTKGGAKGRVMVRGAWAGSRHPARPFSPNYSLAIPGATSWIGWKRRLLPVSASFEIDAKERQCKTLLTARNLMAVVREPQEYVINILPRKMPKERLTLKNAERFWTIGRRKKRRNPSQGSRTETRRRLSSKENSSKKEEAGEEWEGSEGAHSSHGICSSAITHEAEVMIEEPVNPAPHSISSGPDIAGLNHSSTSLAAVALEAVCADPMEEGRKARVSPLTIRTAGSCSGDGATLKEASLGAQSEVRTPRAASRAAARD